MDAGAKEEVCRIPITSQTQDQFKQTEVHQRHHDRDDPEPALAAKETLRIRRLAGLGSRPTSAFGWARFQLADFTRRKGPVSTQSCGRLCVLPPLETPRGGEALNSAAPNLYPPDA
jgi:hypothetical protein